MKRFFGLAIAALVLTVAGVAQAQEYVSSDVMIPMRDGVKLHAVIVRPAGSDAKGAASLPFLMERTPYGVDGYTPKRVAAAKPELAASGYIFVYEDIRGRYGSGGTFVMNRPVVTHSAPTDVDETTDTRDTIEWLLKNVPNNDGKVGVLGISYPGFLAMMAGIDAHPAVKAISPQAPMTNIWLGDDFFHNGAFRETYGFDYVQQLEAQKTDVPADSKEDQYEFFLKNVNFAGAAKVAGIENLPTAKVFLAEPSYVKFLERHGSGAASRQGQGSNARGWRLVGPGRYVGHAGRVCRAASARYKA